jgi:hypothetical protein
MFDRVFAGPCPEDACRLATLRLSANECAEYVLACVTCWGGIGHGEEDFHPVTGSDVEDLRYAQGVPQSGKARGYLGLGDRETSDLIDTNVPIGQTHHANLVHGARRPREGLPCVIE